MLELELRLWAQMARRCEKDLTADLLARTADVIAAGYSDPELAADLGVFATLAATEGQSALAETLSRAAAALQDQHASQEAA